MQQFLKIGPLVLNLRHIESVGLDIEVKGKVVTLVRMNRGHRQQQIIEGQIREKDVVVSYTFEGKAAQAVNAFFSGEMPFYPGYNGWLYDIAQGVKAMERKQAQEQFQADEVKVERAASLMLELPPQAPTQPQAKVGRIDLSKVRSKIASAKEN